MRTTLLVLALTATLSAQDSVTHEATATSPVDLATVTLPRFDPALGDLLGVELRLEMEGSLSGFATEPTTFLPAPCNFFWCDWWCSADVRVLRSGEQFGLRAFDTAYALMSVTEGSGTQPFDEPFGATAQLPSAFTVFDDWVGAGSIDFTLRASVTNSSGDAVAASCAQTPTVWPTAVGGGHVQSAALRVTYEYDACGYAPYGPGSNALALTGGGDPRPGGALDLAVQGGAVPWALVLVGQAQAAYPFGDQVVLVDPSTSVAPLALATAGVGGATASFPVPDLPHLAGFVLHAQGGAPRAAGGWDLSNGLRIELCGR